MVLAGWLLVVIGWLLGAASGVLWMMKYPGQRLEIGYPPNRNRGWRSWTVLGIGLLGFLAFGGELLQTAYGGKWVWLLPCFLMFVFALGALVVPMRWRWATIPETLI